MRLFAGRITARTYRAYFVARAYKPAIQHIDTVQMCIVMHSPLRTQNNDNIAAECEVPTIYHDAGRGGDNARTALFKYVDSLMDAGVSPGLEPEGISMPIIGIGAYNRVHEALRHEESVTDNKRNDPEGE